MLLCWSPENSSPIHRKFISLCFYNWRGFLFTRNTKRLTECSYFVSPQVGAHPMVRPWRQCISSENWNVMAFFVYICTCYLRLQHSDCKRAVKFLRFSLWFPVRMFSSISLRTELRWTRAYHVKPKYYAPRYLIVLHNRRPRTGETMTRTTANQHRVPANTATIPHRLPDPISRITRELHSCRSAIRWNEPWHRSGIRTVTR